MSQAVFILGYAAGCFVCYAAFEADGDFFGAWTWPMMVGVALTAAGALISVYQDRKVRE